MKKLKLYTDLELLKIENSKADILVPFIGQDASEKNPDFNLTYSRFDVYEKTGKEFLEFTTLEDCDACLLPLNYSQGKKRELFEKNISSFVKKVEPSGKKVYVFVGSDIDDFQVNIKNTIIFHNTLYESRRKKNEFSYTFFFEDFIQKYYNGKLQLRHKKDKPVLGFCGFAPPLGQKLNKFYIKESLRLMANYAGFIKAKPSLSAHSYRARALKGILKTDLINKNFLIREKFGFGGPYGALYPGGSSELNKVFRTEYVRNIIESDYTLCVRGIGNNSIRFFEALSCGRIPVFVNTDCVLPYDFEIDWQKHCIFIEERDIDQISEKLLDFHEDLTSEQFIQIQQDNRKLWEEYISPEGFFKNLYKHLQQV